MVDRRAGRGNGEKGGRKDVIHLGDITKIHGDQIEPVDCITFGSPCQDLSIAGRRAGLAGERSGLFVEAVRIIKEMRKATNGMHPTFAIWENVPGAFSSNSGEDFRAVLEELARVEQPDTVIPRPPRGADGAKPEQSPERDGALLGDSSTLNIGESPSVENESLLSQILEANAPLKYYLSERACQGIQTWKSVAGLAKNCAAGNDRVVAEGGAERSIYLENTFRMRRRRQGRTGTNGENRDAIDAPRPDALPTSGSVQSSSLKRPGRRQDGCVV